MADGPTLELYSFSHKNTSLETRDELAFSDEQVRRFLPEARERLGGEWAVLSTCNRSEFYGANVDHDETWDVLADLIGELKNVPEDELTDPDAMDGSEAAHHLFRVAASLESVALGENEILGQVKHAHGMVLESEGHVSVLDQLFQYAVRAGKEVRTETALCEGAVSISSVAVDLAEKIFGNFRNREITLVGAGETAETAAEHFDDAGADHFTVVNRSRDAGEALADRFDGEYRSLDELGETLVDADVVLVATGAQEPLITPSMLRRAITERRHNSIFLIDVSNPRGITPEAGDLPSAYLYNMDDLESVVEDNLETRRREVPRAESIVDHFVEQWERWMQQRQVTPTISTLARYFEDVRQRELSRHEGEHRDELSESEISRLEAFSKGLVKKLLHDPITNLRSAVENNQLSPEDLELVWSLYNLREFEERSDDR